MPVQFDAWLYPSDARLLHTLRRRGARSALIGVGIASGVCVVLGIGLGLLLTPEPGDASDMSDLLSLVLDAIAALALGATGGLTVSGVSVGRLLTATVGSGPDAKRIRNHVLKGTPAATPEDAARALRWAWLATVYLPYQTLSLALLYVGILVNQVAQLLNREPGQGLWRFSAVLAVLLVVVAAVLFPLQLRNAERARQYRDGRPAELAEPSRGSRGSASAE